MPFDQLFSERPYSRARIPSRLLTLPCTDDTDEISASDQRMLSNLPIGAVPDRPSPLAESRSLRAGSGRAPPPLFPDLMVSRDETAPHTFDTSGATSSLTPIANAVRANQQQSDGQNSATHNPLTQSIGSSQRVEVSGVGTGSSAPDTAPRLRAGPQTVTDDNSTKIPKIAHFVWEGGELPQMSLFNVLNFKRLNPDYKVMFWTSRPMNFFRAQDRALTSVTPAYRYMAFKYSREIEVSDPEIVYSQVDPEFRAFHAREKNGPYKNLAAASDITRLVVLQTKGGLYMDVDVSTANPIKEIKGEQELYAQGDDIEFVNSVLASAPGTKATQRMLDMIKEAYMDDELTWDTKRSDPETRHWLTMATTGPDIVYKGGEDSFRVLTENAFGHRSADLSILQRRMGVWNNRRRYELSAEKLLSLGHAGGIDTSSDWAWKLKPGRRGSI